jgi:hypothetical protein
MNGAGARFDGLNALADAVWAVPVPGAPPRLSREGASVGLAILDMVLRQNHVRRLTERLSLVEHGAATRTTEVDIRLSLLDASQVQASRLFQKVTSRSAQAAQQSDTSLALWVPVTRISRLSVSPIDVVDASGRKLPRLTQYETSRLLASGFYRLLRGILSSDATSRQQTDLGRFLFRVDEARWLVQAALIALLTSRTRPLHPDPSPPQAPSGTGGRDRELRAFATGILDKYRGLLQTYGQLLDVAVNDYLLVVPLDTSKDDHLLSYDSPVHVPPLDRKGMVLDWLSPSRGTYRVEYRARVPSSLRSYHVVTETQPGVQVEAMTLVTDADKARVESVAADLRRLADELDSHRPGAAPPSLLRLVELDLQTKLGTLSELLRSRRWDANQADLRQLPAALPTTDRLVDLYRAGPGTLEERTFRPSLVGRISAEDLRTAADEIGSSQLGLDFSLERNPVSNRAHAYWRRSSDRSAEARHVHITCNLTLRDGSAIRPGRVAAYGTAVALTIYTTACLIAQTLWPFGTGIDPETPGAVISVLLLGPGFLYTRLELPGTHTILGRLRASSRHVAHLCIGSAIVLGSAVAADVTGSALRWFFAACTAVPLVASAFLVVRSVDRPEHVFGSVSLPQWLRDRWAFRWRTGPDAIFVSSGSDDG